MIHHNTSPPSPANLSPTAILDFSHANVQRLVATVSQANISSRTFLQMMHLHLVQVIRPVYSVNERQPVSATLREVEGRVANVWLASKQPRELLAYLLAYMLSRSEVVSGIRGFVSRDSSSRRTSFWFGHSFSLRIRGWILLNSTRRWISWLAEIQPDLQTMESRFLRQSRTRLSIFWDRLARYVALSRSTICRDF